MGRKSIAWWHEENIGKHELIPVRITKKVANYRVGAKTYYPGDVVEVPEFAICEDFMARVVEVQKPVAVVAPEPVEEVSPPPEEPAEEPAPEPDNPPKKPAKESKPETSTKKTTKKKKVTKAESATEAEPVAAEPESD